MHHRVVSNCFRWAFALLGVLASSAAWSAESKQVGRLEARHAAGQTLLTFAEVDPPVTEEKIAATRIRELRRQQNPAPHDDWWTGYHEQYFAGPRDRER
jgi:uncharacterized protein with LGFP repeats